MDEKEEIKNYHFKFRKALLENSDEKHDFVKACKEWSHTDYSYEQDTNCICTKNILHNYSIYHYTGKVLEPIGSSCIKYIADNNIKMEISLKTAKKKQINFQKMKEGNPLYCNLCYSGRVVKSFRTYNVNGKIELQNYPILFCSKCDKMIKIQKEIKQTNMKYLKLYRQYKIKLKLKKKNRIRILTNIINEALEKEKQLAATEIYGYEKFRFGMYKDCRYMNIINLPRFKTWFEYMKKKIDGFSQDERNFKLIDYCKYRLI